MLRADVAQSDEITTSTFRVDVQNADRTVGVKENTVFEKIQGCGLGVLEVAVFPDTLLPSLRSSVPTCELLSPLSLRTVGILSSKCE